MNPSMAHTRLANIAFVILAEMMAQNKQESG
jgi:hypothetical protein